MNVTKINSTIQNADSGCQSSSKPRAFTFDNHAMVGFVFVLINSDCLTTTVYFTRL